MADAGALPTETVLEGTLVRLVPLEREHAAALTACGLDPRIWEWMTHRVTDAAGMAAYVDSALSDRDRGTALPFATIDRGTGEVVGTTRFGAIATDDRRAEIGWTWLAPAAWRTGINVEAKRLMLAFGFDDLALRRIELKTDANNARSRAAIEAIGATFEGVFRKHMVREDGTARDSAYYSIVDDEWPDVRALLDARIERRR